MANRDLPLLMSERHRSRGYRVRRAIYLSVIAGALGLLGMFALKFDHWAKTPHPLAQPIEIQLERGMSAKTFVNKAYTAGLVNQEWLFWVYCEAICAL